MDAMETVRTITTAPRDRAGHDHALERRSPQSGFSLIELAIVLGVLAGLLALTVPRYRTFIATQRLRGSVENLASEIRVARERAMATGVDQPIHFFEDTYNADFHIHMYGGAISSVWSFPPGIHYYPAGVQDTVRMKKDGSVSPALRVVLSNNYGRRDTLSVLSSGIVLLR